MILLLTACDGGGSGGSADIDTSTLFPTDLTFQAFRHLAPADYEDASMVNTLDEKDLVMARYEQTGCGGDAWRVELRTGGAWESATPIGAIHFDDAKGLAICEWEDADGTPTTFDPVVTLWEDPPGVTEGEPVTSGSWSSTATREQDLSTYFGRFPVAASFALSGSGELDGWTLTMAPDFGLVLIRASDFTADLVYSR
jgi:hypothetical protein